MRIAHIVCTYPPYYGGMGNVVFESASYLSKLGHDIVVYTPDYFEQKEIKFEEAPEAQTHAESLQEKIDYAKRLPAPLQYGNAAYMPTLAEELDSVDLIHLHYPFFGTANLVRKWKLHHPSKPLVITYHMDTRSPDLKGLLFKYYAKYWMPKIISVADILIASSFDYIKSSDAATQYSTHPEKWVEIPFGVDTNRFKPRALQEEIFARHNLDPGVPTIIFVGGMDKAHYFKGVKVLLDALLMLKRQNIDIQALMIGDGELRQAYENRAYSYGLKNMVRFVGKISPEELPYYYNAAHLCILPSVSQGEAFGMVLLESMASGVPVIASDLPGVRVVARDGGIVFPPGNALALSKEIGQYFKQHNTQLMMWQEKVRQMTEEKYSWERVAEQLSEIYKKLVK